VQSALHVALIHGVACSVMLVTRRPELGAHVDEQPSLLLVLPSSHCSEPVLIPLPRGELAVVVAAVAVRRVAVVAFFAGSEIPLPHAVNVQLLSQPSPFIVLPSSLCARGRRCRGVERVHLAVAAARGRAVDVAGRRLGGTPPDPGSQSSLCVMPSVFTVPSPHTAILQLLRQSS
jgi:hypothetical protein